MMENKEELLVKSHFHTLKYSNNKLWAIGNNQNGQLGIGNYDNTNKFIPCRIDLQEEERINQIALGYNHSFVLTNQNRLFVCGQNSFGQLGLNHFDNQYSFVECPLPLKEEESITSMVLGHHHSLLLTSHSRVLGSGFNYFGQLAQADDTVRMKFVECPLALLHNEKIVKLSAGLNYSRIETNQNRTFFSGDNRQGELGLEMKTIHLQFFALNNHKNTLKKEEPADSLGQGFQSLALKSGLF